MTAPPQPDTVTKLDAMQWGARILMILSLGSGVMLLLMLTGGAQDYRAILFGALHALNFGATMMIGVGALDGHKAMIEEVRRTQDMIREVAGIERRLLCAVDEVGDRRRNQHHN